MSVCDSFHAALDYDLFRFEGSKAWFRGPEPDLSGAYVACLGGAETFGRFIERPFPFLLGAQLQRPVANLGAVNAGLDLYLNDPRLLQVAANARLRVIQIMGAQNMSNRFFQVHPRRNDRFLCASERLVRLYPEVDFTEFHFTRHLLTRLSQVSYERYQTVMQELQVAWLARMKTLLTLLGGPTVLLWFADHPMSPRLSPDLEDQALFVTRPMLEALRTRVAGLVEVDAAETVQSDGTRGMVFAQTERPVAEVTIGPRAHFQVCSALDPVLRPLLAPRA